MEDIVPIFREYGRLERLREDEGLSVEQLERWTDLKRLLSHHLHPDLCREHADKQASLRVPSQLRVRFESDGGMRQGLMTDISRGGVYVATDHPLPIGTRFELGIDLGEGGEMRALSGEVTRVDAGPGSGGTQAGMGVRFVGPRDAQRQLVERLYDRALDEAMRRADS